MEAFGEIGILPKDFYKMRYDDFLLLQAGFYNKRKYEQRLLRRLASIVLQPYTKKGESISDYQLWPIDGDEKLRSEDREYRAEANAHVSEESLKILKAFKDKEESQKPKEN